MKTYKQLYDEIVDLSNELYAELKTISEKNEKAQVPALTMAAEALRCSIFAIDAVADYLETLED